MKKVILFFASILVATTVYSAKKLVIAKTDQTSDILNVSAIDSITFNDNISFNIYKTDYTVQTIALSDIDSMYFDGDPDTVSITFSENAPAAIVNPLANQGVSVDVNGSDVVITSTLNDNEVVYSLQGTSSDGSVKFYGDFKFDIVLNGLNLTNTDGPAINNQSRKRTTVFLADGTVNTLVDGTTYAASDEDQKGTFFSEGQLIFKGNGTLNVTGNHNHAICSDDYIEVEGGNIVVDSAANDGIHTKGHFNLEGGNVKISASGDGVDCEGGRIKIEDGTIKVTENSVDKKAIKCDSTLNITGGNVQLTVNGNQAKGLKSDGIMNLNGGNISINTTGDVVLSASGLGYDPSSCSAIKGDAGINIGGAIITITESGFGAKGIKSAGDINMTAGNVTITCTGSGATYTNSLDSIDSYSSDCISSDGAINILSGTLVCSNSGSGGKAVRADGAIIVGGQSQSPTLKLTTTGTRFAVSTTTTTTNTGGFPGGPPGGGPGGSTSSTDYCHPKTLMSSSPIIINSGNITINSTDDGIHSDASVSINGGNITINAISTEQGVGEGVEAPVITFNGGQTLINASNDGINATYGTVSGGTESNDGSYLYMKSGIVITNGTDAVDSNGNILMTGGVLIANGPQSGVEEGVDCNGNFDIDGGTLISAGANSNMSKAMSTTSTQPGMFIESSSLIPSTSLLHIENSSGTEMLTYKPKNGGYYFHFSSPQLAKGSTYKIYSGGTYSGGSFVGGTSGYGLYAGGTYSTSGATLKKTVTLSTSSTVNTITF